MFMAYSKQRSPNPLQGGGRRQTHPLIPSEEGTSCSWRIPNNGRQIPSRAGCQASDPPLNPLQGGDFHIHGVFQTMVNNPLPGGVPRRDSLEMAPPGDGSVRVSGLRFYFDL